MKTNLILIGIIVLLLIFGGVKSCNVRKLATEKATLKAEFEFLKGQKLALEIQNINQDDSLRHSKAEKKALETSLSKERQDANKLISGLKKQVSDLKLIPIDTLYLDLFSKWPTFDQVLKYRFAENQVREMYLNVLERDHYLTLSEKINKSLLTCTNLNIKNNEIISNLSGQNENLKSQVDLSDLQIVNLQDNLKLSDKTLNKQKRKTFFYQVGTIAAATGLVIFAVK